MENTAATTEPVAPAGELTSRADFVTATSNALREELKKQGLVKEETVETAPVAPAPLPPAETPPPPESVPTQGESIKTPVQAADPLSRSFEKLAIEKSNLRKEMAAFKAEMEAFKRFRSTGEEPPPVPASKPTHSNGIPEELNQRLARLEQFEQQQQKTQLLGTLKTAVHAEKYPYIAALGEHEAVMNAINDYHARTGELPGGSFEETVSMAAEYVEKNLKTQAERFGKVNGLTKTLPPPNNATQATRESPAGQGSPGKTLTNSTTAPIAVAVKPQTSAASREELLKELFADPGFKALK